MLILPVLLLQAPSAPAGPRDLSAQFQHDPALEVTLFAESPQLFNPTAIDVDARGRVWVAEAVNYRQWRGRNPGRHHEAGDRILILEDVDGDGVCDTSKVFVQEPGLVAPLGLCVLGNQVLVSCSPDVLLYTDTDGDDVPDQREVFLTGFGGRDHDHGLHSFVPGPDGQWYFNTGNAGPHTVRDKLGWTLRSGSIYRDGGESLADNKPGLVSDDGQVWTGGLALRIRPRGEKLTVLAHNFRNNYEVALDSFGNLFQSDNDDDGNQACRTLWCVPGGNHGYFSADGARTWQADRRPGQDVQSAHWHQEDPGVAPAGCVHGAGGPTGLCVYEGQLLPARFHGVVLDCDAGANAVYAHTPRRAGAGIALEHGEFLSSRVPDVDERQGTWFRPSDVCAATDGSVFVSDWWDPGVGGHAAGDREAYGRILCVRPKGAPRQRPVHELRTIPGAIAALSSPAVGVRWLGWRKLVEERQLAVPALKQLLAGGDRRLAARALWVLTTIPEEANKVIDQALVGADVDLAVTAFRALHANPPLRTQTARQLVERGVAPGLLGEIALTLRDYSFDSTWPVWQALANKWDGQDRWMLELLGLGARGKEERIYQTYIPGGDPLKWKDAHATLAWRLHPKAAIPAFIARANARELSSAQRRQALEALCFRPEREAAEAVVNLALAGPEDLRELAAWWVRQRDENLWSEYRLARELAPASREGATLAWSSGVLERGSKSCAVELDGASALWLVVTEGARGNGCDWADWLDARLIGPQGAQPLDGLRWASATAGWGAVRVGRNADGGPLEFDGRVRERGLGTHAASEIVYRLPAGAFTRFEAECALDDGGTSQGGRPDVEFQVWLERAPDRSVHQAHARTLADPTASESAQREAARALAAEREGGLLLIRLADERKLFPAARTAAAEALHKNPDLAVRALASRAFPRVDAGGTPLPPLRELAALSGDARRGRELFFGAQAGCSTCHAFQGRGGDTGPDLTEIGRKYGREALVDALLNPSAAISFGYDSWIVETKDGQLFSGFVLADGDKLVLKDTSGKRTVLESSEIALREKQRVSAMPDNVALGLGAQAIADLTSLLVEASPSPGKHGAPLKLFDGTSLAGWRAFLSDPKVAPESVWTARDGVLRCAGQPVGYLATERLYTSFVLTLEWRFPPGSQGGNSGVLLRVQEPEQVWPKSVEAQLMHRNAGDIWNIGEFPLQVERGRTEGRRTHKLLPSNERPIGEWNRYRITLDRGDLTLEVNGEVQNRGRWCEIVPGRIALQSEGAAIEFREIVLTPIE